MAQPKDAQRFTEIEYCLTRYFNCHILPVMKQEKDALNSAQAKEIADYSRSFAGFMRSFANAVNNQPDDTLLYLRATGKECSKKAEDYVDSCKNNIAGNKDIQKDMQRLACDWRTAVIGEIGRERYDQLSQKLGADLALAYIDHRLEQMMVNRMVTEQMPKSSFEYILRKGVSGSLFGMAYEVQKSPLEAEIAERGEAAYNPSSVERYTAKGVTVASDAIAMGGVYSWASLARVAGTEVVFAGLESVLDKKSPKGLTVDEVLSQAIFGGNGNRFADFRRNTMTIKEYDNDYLQNVNKSLSKKMNLFTEKPFWETNAFGLFSQANNQESNARFPFQMATPFQKFLPTTQNATSARNPDVPLVIAPGHEQEYLDFLELQKQEKKKQKSDTSGTVQAVSEINISKNNSSEQQDKSENQVNNHSQSDSASQSEETNQDGWSGLLQSFGLDGISDVGRNLPYVIAMLPDMLVGLLTGKTQSIGLKKDMIPIASILMGMFVSNPLLKMVLIGMGGANLFNKVGHEAIERNTETPRRQYRQYADEELNPRIVNPVLKGNVMVATIDGIPCSVSISYNAAEAVTTGALPLNTLANAILAKHDSMRETELNNTRNIDMDTTVTRDRGMTLK
ncbi:MAG: hypothetical protein K2J00_02885 [Bacteroidaceae bacterium]|nr:hypothetical protein [Bacteroidaceae bacterium]